MDFIVICKGSIIGALWAPTTHSLTTAFSFSALLLLISIYPLFYFIDIPILENLFFLSLPSSPPPFACCLKNWLWWRYYKSCLSHLVTQCCPYVSFGILSTTPPIPIKQRTKFYLPWSVDAITSFPIQSIDFASYTFEITVTLHILPLTYKLNFICPFRFLLSQRGKSSLFMLRLISSFFNKTQWMKRWMEMENLGLKKFWWKNFWWN